ncbi:MAG: hypothetical protein WCI36_01940 [bacterium]
MEFQNQNSRGTSVKIGTQNDAKPETAREKTFQAMHHFSSSGARFSSGAAEHHKKEEEFATEPKKIVGLLDKFIVFCLGAIFFGVPIFFTGLTLQGISFEKQIYFYFWLLLALVAWVSKGVITGEMKIKKTPLDVPIVLLWIFYGISMAFSVDKWHSFWGFFGDPSRGFMFLTSLIIAYYLIVSNFDKKRFALMGMVLVAANFLLALWATLNFLGLQIVPAQLAPFVPLSPIGSLTGMSIFFGAMLPLLISLIFGSTAEEGKKKSKLFLIEKTFIFVTIALNLFVLLVLYTFVPWLSVLLGSSFFLIYILAQIVRPRGNQAWIPMFVFVAILTILMIGVNSIARIQLPIEASPSYQLSWDIAKESLKQKLLIGSGPATYGYNFSLNKPQTFNINQYYDLRFFQGSGVFFESLSTLGIAGTITVVLLALTFVSIGVYLLSINKAKNKIYSLGVFSAALVFLVGSFTGKIEGSILLLGALLGAMAVSMLMSESDSEDNFLLLSLKASPKFALALAFVFMVVSAGVVFLFIFIGKIYLADLSAGDAMREKKITQEGSVKKLAVAINWNGRESHYYTLIGQELMSLANEQTLKGEKDRNLELIQKYINDSITEVNIASALSPNDVTAIEALAQIYENSGLYVADSFSFAETNYKKALDLEPHNPNYQVKLGQIKLAQASAKKTPDEAKAVVREAKDFFQKAIDEKGNFAIAYYQLALAQEALGEMDSAIKSIETAAISEQNNLNYVYNTARMHQARGNDEDNKIAEAIYKNILSKNEKEVNTLFSLGLLYEKTKRTSEASAQYKKVLELLPKDNADVRTKIQKMISNIAAGIENKPENLVTEVAPTPAPAAAQESPAPETTTQPVNGQSAPIGQ